MHSLFIPIVYNDGHNIASWFEISTTSDTLLFNAVVCQIKINLHSVNNRMLLC